jgi:SAM-dependent methyltransferase
VSLAQTSEFGHRNGAPFVISPPNGARGIASPDAIERAGNAEHLLTIAAEWAVVRTRLPAKLERFPFNAIPAVERFFLRALAYLFKDQRQVNEALIGATRELAAAIRAESVGHAELTRSIDRLTEASNHHDGAIAQALAAAADFAELVEAHHRVVNQLVDGLSHELVTLEQRHVRADENASGIRGELDEVKARLQDAADWTTTVTQAIRTDVETVRRESVEVREQAAATTDLVRVAENAFSAGMEQIRAETAQQSEALFATVDQLGSRLDDAADRFERDLPGALEPLESRLGAIESIAVPELSSRIDTATSRSEAGLAALEPLESRLGAIESIAVPELSSRIDAATSLSERNLAVAFEPLESRLGAIESIAVPELSSRINAATGVSVHVESLERDFKLFRESALGSTALMRESLALQRDVTAGLLQATRMAPQNAGNREQSLAPPRSDHLQVALADSFRGSEDSVKRRLSVYLPFLASGNVGSQRRTVLDIGFGRGEWLELLRENGYGAFGIEANQVLLDRAQAGGYDVIGGDARAALRTLEDCSLRCITAFHVVEHLAFEELLGLLTECRRLLEPGGLLILETPNPENVVVGSANFYLDPTHIQPYPMQLLRFLVEQRGFSNVETLALNPNTAARLPEATELDRRFNDFFYCAMDYGTIGRC